MAVLTEEPLIAIDVADGSVWVPLEYATELQEVIRGQLEQIADLTRRLAEAAGSGQGGRSGPG